MPYLKLQTNKDISEDKKKDLIRKMSKLAAETLKKPEGYVMAVLEPNLNLLFGGLQDPAVFMELKSIGLSDSETKTISKKLCNFVKENLNISEDRIYIEFASSAGSMWGWNGGTF